MYVSAWYMQTYLSMCVNLCIHVGLCILSIHGHMCLWVYVVCAYTTMSDCVNACVWTPDAATQSPPLSLYRGL